MSADDRLRLIVERIERLIEERKGIGDDIRDAYAEAKAVGYDAATIRRLIARRAMKPEDRVEADLVLETYEAALGGLAEPGPSIEELRPDAAALAVSLLAAQIVGLEDEGQAGSLVEHVLFLLDLRAEIAALRAQETHRKKLAHGEGFDPKQIAITVRWFEKCAKHGEEAMRAGEATFRLYRATVDGHDRERRPLTQDERLAAAFAPPAARPKKITSTVARMRADAEAARRALGER